MPRIADVLERESHTVDLEPGDFERLLGRRERKQRNRRIRAGALGVIVALAMGLALVKSVTSSGAPADQPEPRPAPTVSSGALAYALDGDIYVAEPDGTNAVKIADGSSDTACPRSEYSAVSWSPDGSRLAFDRYCPTSDRKEVVITDLRGTGIAAGRTYGWGLTWSPDSTRVAVWEDIGKLGVYGVDGERVVLPMPRVTGGGNDAAPEWMPDGAALLVFGYAVVPLDGSTARELSLGGQASYSPDGSHIAVVGDRSTVVTDADGATVSQVDRPLRGAMWSPDGDRLAWVSHRGDLFVIDVASGRMTVLTEGANVVRGFSPQGDRILYASLVRDDAGGFYNDLYGIGVDGSGPQLLVAGTMQGQWRPR